MVVSLDIALPYAVTAKPKVQSGDGVRVGRRSDKCNYDCRPLEWLQVAEGML